MDGLLAVQKIFSGLWKQLWPANILQPMVSVNEYWVAMHVYSVCLYTIQYLLAIYCTIAIMDSYCMDREKGWYMIFAIVLL